MKKDGGAHSQLLIKELIIQRILPALDISRMFYTTQRKRLAKNVESMFLKLYPDTTMFSNEYVIEWYGSGRGLVVSVKRIACETQDVSELGYKVPQQVEDFKEFVELFSVCFIYTEKHKLKKIKKVSCFKPTNENLKHRFYLNLQMNDGIANTFQDIMRVRRANHPEYLPF